MLSREWPLKNCSRDTVPRLRRRVSSELLMQGLAANNQSEERAVSGVHSAKSFYIHPRFLSPSNIHICNCSILLILVSHSGLIIGFCLRGNVSSELTVYEQIGTQHNMYRSK